ncbi:uncharacterized protein HMPREF1541_00837 [Cyphellophora europaea CBS 101466]|uniref:Ribosomal protein s17 n=1 Tax=Cyphellophora europaea (strain CBS 101466) TaxID=1220924 RepID=W2SD48_CYPE1|nr:uncharacterized protein HMPREF1541_00837 [Cyphellophora europaea CBS 101466]ETN46651.1 hypothetical protein HMPREF1541_00837 [Cyphellophora europaea CBS 101466]
MRLSQALLIALTTYSVGVSAQFGGFGGGNGGGFGGGNNGGQGGNNDQGGNNNGQGQDQNGQNGQNNGGNNNGQDQNNNNNNGGDNGGNNNGGGATLQGNARQDASADTGGADAEAGQADSATDDNNFINFCAGKQLTNGQQVQGGSCNGIVMGEIPSTGNMISSFFQNPTNGDDIQADQTFTIDVQVDNLEAGTFTNPDTTYYSAPQALQNGRIVGHTHVTCQVTQGNNPPNPQEFAFFKGINDAGNGNGLLSAEVEGGLAAGSYRCCTMTSAANHQPVIMPVAQRGAQDDCIQFTVGQGNGGNNNNNNNNNGGGGNNNNGQDQNNNNNGGQDQNNNNGGQDQGQNGQGQDQGQNGQGQGGNGGFGGQGGGFGGGQGGGFGGGFGGRKKGRFMARGYVA